MATESDDLRAALEAAFDDDTTNTEPDTEELEVEEVEEELEADSEADIQEDVEEVEESEPEIESLAPPASWSKEKWDIFQSLPRDAQEYILQRDTEVNRGVSQKFEEAAKIRKKYEPLEEILQPYQEQWSLKGLDAPTVIRRLVAAQNLLDRNPQAGLAHIAQSYGLSLNDLAKAAQSQPQADPQVLQLRQELAYLKNSLQQREQQEVQQLQSSLEQEVVSFANEEVNGQPARPHFEAVASDMMPLVGQLREQNPTWSNQQVLQEAYERASWANPTIRQQILAQQQAEAKAQRIKEQKAKAAQAKKAGSSVSGAPGGGQAYEAPAGSLREELYKAFDKLGV